MSRQTHEIVTSEDDFPSAGTHNTQLGDVGPRLPTTCCLSLKRLGTLCQAPRAQHDTCGSTRLVTANWGMAKDSDLDHGLHRNCHVPCGTLNVSAQKPKGAGADRPQSKSPGRVRRPFLQGVLRFLLMRRRGLGLVPIERSLVATLHVQHKRTHTHTLSLPRRSALQPMSSACIGAPA